MILLKPENKIANQKEQKGQQNLRNLSHYQQNFTFDN
jgi:hypothetical protein